MYRGTPSRRYQSSRYEDRSYGASANTRQNSRENFQPRAYGNYADRFARTNQSFRNTFSSDHRSEEANNHTYMQHSNAVQHAPRDTIDSTATFSSTIVDPVPAPSLINRLMDSETLSAVPDMKHVDRLPKHLLESFGDSNDDWYVHINKLELDVFQKHAFNGMQCYFALKGTLKGRANTTMYNLETGMETPKWRDFIPGWFHPTREDWMA